MTAPAALVAAALTKVAEVVGALSCAQLEDLAAGRVQFVLQSGDAERDGFWISDSRREKGPCPAPPVVMPMSGVPAAGVPASAVEVTDAVGEISRLGTSAEVADYLRLHDRRFTTPVLKEIARALGPTVSAAGRSKSDLRRNIVEGTAGFRERTAAMSGGAWS
ncbi:MAG: hypothetical protein LH603_18260 [Pseudonocardia sp.]|nr:hypothetical protein [Pseudonocardia sp.]